MSLGDQKSEAIISITDSVRAAGRIHRPHRLDVQSRHFVGTAAEPSKDVEMDHGTECRNDLNWDGGAVKLSVQCLAVSGGR